jgi:hypothetical protein
VCAPSCVCHNTTVIVNVDSLAVTVHDDSARVNGPRPRYRHSTVAFTKPSSAAADNTSAVLLLFGGERYNPSVYVIRGACCMALSVC